MREPKQKTGDDRCNQRSDESKFEGRSLAQDLVTRRDAIVAGADKYIGAERAFYIEVRQVRRQHRPGGSENEGQNYAGY